MSFSGRHAASVAGEGASAGRLRQRLQRRAVIIAGTVFAAGWRHAITAATQLAQRLAAAAPRYLQYLADIADER